ncbi:MAG: hypothetical protein KAT05_11865 [Spirochaetes bacterium]|nr:hypothetical protein [Spirochaetota bacterium]
MNKYLLIFMLIVILSISCFASQKGEVKSQKNIYSFKVFNHTKSLIVLSNLYTNHTSQNLIELLAFSRGGRSETFRIGLNLLVFSISCGVVGGMLIGLGFILVWAYSLLVGLGFTETLAAVFILYASSIKSTYISFAIACWVIGGILGVFFLAIIPAIILMAVGAARSVDNRFHSLNDAIGVGISL